MYILHFILDFRSPSKSDPQYTFPESTLFLAALVFKSKLNEIFFRTCLDKKVITTCRRSEVNGQTGKLMINERMWVNQV